MDIDKDLHIHVDIDIQLDVDGYANVHIDMDKDIETGVDVVIGVEQSPKLWNMGAGQFTLVVLVLRGVMVLEDGHIPTF